MRQGNPPIVCYVTDRRLLPDGGAAALVEKIAAAAAAGADFLQIREKDLPSGELLALIREAMRAVQTAASRTRVIVNDRLDLALASGAAGVHLGWESAPPRDVLNWCRRGNAPAEFLVGVSCHSIEQAREAESIRASYAFFGHVFATPSKRQFGPPRNLAKLAKVCRAVQIPVLAIGGVNLANAADCLRAGAAGVAAIRLFQQATDPEALKAGISRLHESGSPDLGIRR